MLVVRQIRNKLKNTKLKDYQLTDSLIQDGFKVSCAIIQ